MKNDKKIDLIGSGLKPSFVFSLNENQINVLHKRLTESKKEQKEAVTKQTTSTTYSDSELQKGVPGGSVVKKNPDGTTTITKEGEMTEKAVSKQQQKFFGVVSAMQKGDIPKKGKAGKAAKEMSKKDVKDFASTKHKGLPKKVEDKKIEESLSKIIESQLFPTMTKNDLMETISRLMNEQPTIAPTKPGIKEPGTKEKEKEEDKRDPFRRRTTVQPKPSPKAETENIPAPKAQKGNIPDWFTSSSIGIK